jgi:hypothetical protein
VSAIAACPLRGRVDPRLLRFSAAATGAVLLVALLLVPAARPLAMGLLASQVAVLGFTAAISFQWSVWARLFARFVWPRLDAPATLVADGRARVAQGVCFALATTGLAAFVLDADVLGIVLVAVVVGVAAVTALFPGLLAG